MSLAMDRGELNKLFGLGRATPRQWTVHSSATFYKEEWAKAYAEFDPERAKQMLDEIDAADGIVLGAPVNFSTVTAIMKRFIERLLPYCYWPWGNTIPRRRIKTASKKAIAVTSSGCPTWLGRIIFSGALSVLKAAAKCMGAKVVKSLYLGKACQKEKQELTEKAILAAQKAGEKLVL